jgi:hypothetical protein
MSFSPVFYRLQQEGFIVRSCLAAGINELRSSHCGEKGRYYTGFFQLAIALERLAKLGLILDHMVSHDLAPPGRETIKTYGHKVVEIYKLCAEVACRRKYGFSQDFALPTLEARLLTFLSDFGNGTRYANLDALASGIAGREPLAEWSKILDEIICTDVSETERIQIINESAELSGIMNPFAIVLVHDLENKPLSLEEYLSQPRLQAVATRHLVWHLVLIVTPLKELVCELAHEARAINRRKTSAVMDIPDMAEFFDFLWADKAYVLGKEEWP